MCGFAGAYGLRDAAAMVAAMSAAIAHRGPDSAHVYGRDAEGWSAHLGFRRLSIIDLSSAADQPFVKGDLVLTFNGEIYNYKALREELAAAGVSFRTSGDTEVVLEAWRQWGPASLSRLRGMFAFALLDERTGELVLARDHFGIKPLFVAHRDGGTMFASELKGLLAGTKGWDVDLTGVVASLLYYWVPDSRSSIQGVEKLPPGHWLQLEPGGKRTLHRWYDLREEAEQASERTVGAEELRVVLEDSLKAHLVADVPISTFLSGGLDSSLLTVLAANEQPVDSYTISFRAADQKLEAMPDDLSYARKVATAHGIELHEIEIAPDVTEILPKMVSILDEPIGDAAAINAYLICSAAREAGVKVLLSGMGADELFGGYRKHYANLLAARYRRVPGALRNGVVSPIVDRLPVAGKNRGYRTVRFAKRFLDFASLPEEAAFRRSYTHYGVEEAHGLLDPSLWPAVDDLVDEHAALYADAPTTDHVNRMCYVDTRYFLPGLNLAYTDRASMAASTEVRVPFVDRDVVAAAFAIPGSAKIKGRSRKDVLKDAARPHLTDEIVDRPKGLFSAPLRAWIRRDLTEMVDDLVVNGKVTGSGLVRRDAVEAMVAEDRKGTADRSKEIWQLLTLELWWREHAGA